MNLTVSKIERIWIDVPFRALPAKHMVRELPHWTLFEISLVTLKCGVTGFGETMCYYTWGTVGDDDVGRVTGRNAAECMWDDSLGAGLQMALFDAVGRATDTPCWALLGNKHRDRAFVSWWDIDMPGEDWLLECKEALSQGYTSFKSKARPWFDLKTQLETLSGGLPPWFDVDMDFNGLLVNSTHAARVLPTVDRFSNVAIFETPLPQDDVPGQKRVRDITNTPIALHYGVPSFTTALRENICDGFVVGGGATGVCKAAAAISEVEKVFWLQLVGTGITAVWGLHFGAVLSAARWPAVNCHQLYTEQLVEPVMDVSNGLALVPEAPGLGVDLDREAVEKYRIEPKEKPYPAPDILIAIRWPSGTSSYYTHAIQYWREFQDGRLPVFPAGVYLEQVMDDGSAEWKELRQKALEKAVHVSGREA